MFYGQVVDGGRFGRRVLAAVNQDKGALRYATEAGKVGYFAAILKERLFAWQERTAIKSGRFTAGGDGRKRDREEFEAEFGA
tara:strand:+ start:2413 stop:2658 length:246 start_codon:yes stop_codon:yes gene_type:complete